MQVLIAVIDDLFQFARNAFSGSVPYAHTADTAVHEYQKTLQKIQSRKPLPVASPKVDQVDTQEAFRIGEQYFVGTIGALLYQDPVLVFDNSLSKLTYGQNVRLISLKGRWAQVRLAGTVGWVFKDSLMLQSDDVYPRFQLGVSYDAHQKETVKLRACIDDMFSGSVSESALSSAEYVHYRLAQKRRFIQWGDIRGRIAGTWQQKLAGGIGIHIGIAPKTESVMEYIVDNIGHLAFVESVFPDGSMKISEIGKFDNAFYTEETITPEEWKELRPVFIEVE